MKAKPKNPMTVLCVALLAVMAAGTVAEAAVETIRFDFRQITVQARDAEGGSPVAFTDNFTGFLDFGLSNVNAGTTLDTISRDNTEVTPGPQSLDTVSGGLDFDSGLITGGTVSFGIENPDMHVDTLTFTIPDGSSIDVFALPSPFGTTAMGMGEYTITESGGGDGLFAGTDIGGFFATPGDAIFGEFLFFGFMPDPGTGFDPDVQMDISAVIPVPPAVWAGGSLLALLAIGKVVYSRRRRDQDQRLGLIPA